MNSENQYEISEATLTALRDQKDAVRLISEKLGVKEMGPADHIRTKHEARAFVEKGELDAAQKLIQRARERRAQGYQVRLSSSQKRGESLNQ